MTERAKRRQRGARKGMPGFAWVVILPLAFPVAFMAGAWVSPFGLGCRFPPQSPARTIRSAAQQWQASEGRFYQCPSYPNLLTSGTLDPEFASAIDDRTIRILCTEELGVRWAGPDGRFETADDEVLPRAKSDRAAPPIMLWIGLSLFALSAGTLVLGTVTEHRQRSNTGPVATIPTLPYAVAAGIPAAQGLLLLRLAEVRGVAWWQIPVVLLLVPTFGVWLITAVGNQAERRRDR